MADDTAEYTYRTGDDTSRCREQTRNENVTSVVRRCRTETIEQDFVSAQFVNLSDLWPAD